MQTILLWFFLINGLYIFRTFTCPSSGVLTYRLFHCRMWCYAIGVEAVVLRSWCVVLCTVCQCYVSQLAFMSETKILNYTAYNNRSPTFTGSLVQSNVYSVQPGTPDLAQRRKSILQLWPCDLVLSETFNQQGSMTISVQLFTALCTFDPNLSNRTRISARTVPQ